MSNLEECSVCCDPLDPNGEEIIKLSCGHTFHYNCILQSYRAALNMNRYSSKRECPYCRNKGEYLELKPGVVPMRGIHKEYNLLRGRQIKIEFLRENFFDPNKCQCLLISGANRYQQCSRKPNKDTTDGIPMCSLHIKKPKKSGFIYFPV